MLARECPFRHFKSLRDRQAVEAEKFLSAPRKKNAAPNQIARVSLAPGLRQDKGNDRYRIDFERLRSTRARIGRPLETLFVVKISGHGASRSYVNSYFKTTLRLFGGMVRGGSLATVCQFALMLGLLISIHL
jgi:hypothetical protein